MEFAVDVPTVLSGLSILFTAYFWLVKAREERPKLKFYQLTDFRPLMRNHPRHKHLKRLCVQQRGSGGVLVVNHSTRQNSIVVFDCFLQTIHGELRGEWGYGGDDKPPWNIAAGSTVALSPACFFDVPPDFEVDAILSYRLCFITASGKQFSHRFMPQAPVSHTADDATEVDIRHAA